METGTLLIAPQSCSLPSEAFVRCDKALGLFLSHSKSFFLLYLGLSPTLGYELTALSLAWKCSVPEGRIWLDLNNDICNVPSDRTRRTPTGADKHPACREVFVNPPQCLSASSHAFLENLPWGGLEKNCRNRGGGSVCLSCWARRDLNHHSSPTPAKSPGDGLFLYCTARYAAASCLPCESVAFPIIHRRANSRGSISMK